MMKKLFLVPIFLGLCVNAFAGTISIAPFISGNDVTIPRLETQRTTIQNVINGSIEGGINIKAGSLVSQDFANSTSPVTRWDESFTDFVVSGMLAPTSASLSSTTTAGTAYTDGFRVVIGSTAHTYTASKDTYVYVHSGGYYVYQEVANGASTPSTPSNTQVLFKAVTDGTTVSSVTDLRQLGITLTSSVNIVPLHYRTGMTVSADSVSTIGVQAGSVEVNSTRVAKTTSTTLTLGTAGDWSTGVSQRTTSAYGYIGVDSSGNIKMDRTTGAPTHSDYALTSTVGIKRYVSWNSTTYRVIGWFYMNATGSGELNAWEVGNIRDDGSPNTSTVTAATEVNPTATSYTAISGMTTHMYSTGRPVAMSGAIRSLGDTNNNVISVAVDADGFTYTDTQLSAAKNNVGSDGDQFYHNLTVPINVKNLSQGTHTITLKSKINANTQSIKERSLTFTEL